MGGVCTANENQKATIECPHRKKAKPGHKKTAIKQEIGTIEGKGSIIQFARSVAK